MTYFRLGRGSRRTLRKAVRLEDSVEFGIHAHDGSGLIVIGESPAIAILVATDIEWIGDDRIDGCVRQSRQDGEAIAVTR